MAPNSSERSSLLYISSHRYHCWWLCDLRSTSWTMRWVSHKSILPPLHWVLGLTDSKSFTLAVYVQTKMFLIGFEGNSGIDIVLHRWWFCCLFKDSRHSGNRVRKLRNLSWGFQIQVVWDCGHWGLDSSSSSLSQAPPQRVVFKVDVPLQCNAMQCNGNICQLLRITWKEAGWSSNVNLPLEPVRVPRRQRARTWRLRERSFFTMNLCLPWHLNFN